jgi:hypothetical protein
MKIEINYLHQNNKHFRQQFIEELNRVYQKMHGYELSVELEELQGNRSEELRSNFVSDTIEALSLS